MSGRDKAVQMAVGLFKRLHVAFDLWLKRIELGWQPVQVEIAAQSAGLQQAAQKAAAGEDPIQLFALLCKQLSEITRTRRYLAFAGCLYSLTERERMRDAANGGDALRYQNSELRSKPLKSFLHAAMFEEQSWVTMQNCLPYVIERDLRRFEHIAAHRPEWQHLDVAAFDRRQLPRHRCERDHLVLRVARIERRHRRTRAFVQHQRTRFRMAGKSDAAEVHHLPLIPPQ